MRRSAAGDFDYERDGASYATVRRPDPRIAAVVHAALGAARTVVNVGAGAGSYEPPDRYVAPIEPSATMRSQRPDHLAPAIDATAEQLPFDDDAFDAAMAAITVHQWRDAAAGLREMRRVARGPVVVLTFDRDALDRLWLAEYAPELLAAERRRYQPLDWIAEQLGGTATATVTVTSVPVPIDCTDGFAEAFYARPHMLLRPEVRRSQSGWGFVDDAAEDRAVRRLRADLDSGAWHQAHGHLLDEPTFDGSLRLLVAQPEPKD